MAREMGELNRFLPEELRGEVVLRLPEADDVESMLSYFESLGEASRGFFHPHPFDRENAEKICADCPADAYRVVAECAGKIVGYAWFGPTKGSEYPSVGIGISDAFQGKRLGGALMDCLSCEARRRGLPGLRLTVYKNNERGIRLYGSRGYRIVGEEKGQHVMEVLFHDRHSERSEESRDSSLRSE